MIVIIALLLPLLSACGARFAQGLDKPTAMPTAAIPMMASAPAVAALPSETATAVATPTSEPPPMPAVVIVVTTATLPAASGTPPASTATPSATPPAIATEEPTATLAAAPTFTPPPPPERTPGEHFAFGRPVPPETVAWTDKSYPYGGTKGGALMVHHGVEFAVQSGTPVLAAAAGTVVVAGSDTETIYGPQPDFYGNLVVLEHASTAEGKPLYTLYGHLSEVQVEVGQAVGAGEQIALSGASGVAFGPHLHFEVRVGANEYGSTRNPVLWLRPFEGDGVVVARVSWPSGEPAAGVPITLRRLDAPSAYATSASYAAEGVNGDDTIRENFALDDVSAGYYEVIVGSGAGRQVLDLWVYAGELNLIEITLQ